MADQPHDVLRPEGRESPEFQESSQGGAETSPVFDGPQPAAEPEGEAAAPTPPTPPTPVPPAATAAVDPETERDDEGDPDPVPQEMDAETAGRTLQVLLSAGDPPPPPEENFRMGALTERMARKLGKEVGTKPDELAPIIFRARGLLDPEIEEISERAIKYPNANERKLGIGPREDKATFQRLFVAESILVPQLDHPQMLQMASARGYAPEIGNVVRVWLLPGEIDLLFQHANRLTGWAANAVERAKG